MSNILLISPPANEVRKSYPYSLIFLSSYLRKHGFENKVIDCDVLGYDSKGLVEILKFENPIIIGITGYSRYRFAAYDAIREIKRNFPDCIIVVGGRHFSALAVETLENLPDVDFVVRGEGEIPFKELCEAIINKDSVEGIKNITYRVDNNIISTPDSSPEKDIEKFSYQIKDLPEGPYHLKVPVSLKKGEDISNPVSIMTSRGCSGKCVYCCLSAGRVRYRDSVAVVDQIEEKMQIAGTNEISIPDSSFTVNKNHVISICDEILKRGLDIKWRCQSRVDIDIEILKLMKDSGCAEISVGVETASPKVLKSIKKKINLDQVVRFLEISKKLDISVLTYFMVSLPDETENDAEMTFKFLKEIAPLVYKPAMQVAQIYPDAQLYYIAKERGLLPKNFDWFSPYKNKYNKDLGGRENIPFYIENLSVEYLRDYLVRYNKFYMKNFFYKDDFQSAFWGGIKALVLDWKSEDASKKINSIANGFRAVYGIIKKY